MKHTLTRKLADIMIKAKMGILTVLGHFALKMTVIKNSLACQVQITDQTRQTN